MPKKNRLSNRLTLEERSILKSDLARYKSGPPLTKLAKHYGVSTSTVNHHWLAVKKARKAKVVTPAVQQARIRPIKGYDPVVLGELAHGAGVTLMTSSAANGSSLSPSIKAMVDSALEKKLLTLRKRIEAYVNEAMRK